MPRIAFVNVGAHGHVNPTLPVAAELTRRGAEVHYFAPESFRDAIERTGARFESYDSQFGKDGPPPGVTTAELMAMMPARLTGECLHVLPALEARLAAIKPDLIAYDKF